MVWGYTVFWESTKSSKHALCEGTWSDRSLWGLSMVATPIQTYFGALSDSASSETVSFINWSFWDSADFGTPMIHWLSWWVFILKSFWWKKMSEEPKPIMWQVLTARRTVRPGLAMAWLFQVVSYPTVEQGGHLVTSDDATETWEEDHMPTLWSSMVMVDDGH